MSRRRRLGLALGVAAAALLVWWVRTPSAKAAGEDWVPVRREDLVIGVPVTGTLAAVESTLLGPPLVEQVWDYKISFMAPEGSVVRAGQPVLAFDSSELERTLIEKTAERDSAAKEFEKRNASLEVERRDDELQLAEAEAKKRKSGLKVDVPAELEAKQKLAEAKADLDLAEREIAYLRERIRLRRREAEAELRALAAKRDSAGNRVAEARDAITRMTVLAPRAGTVIYSTGPRGDKKKIGDSCWRAETPIELPDLTRMRADGTVEEADAGRIAVGQVLTLRLDAHPDTLFPGRVATVGSTVHVRSRNEAQKVVDVELALFNTDPQRMRPGMRFVGTIEAARVRRALVVPVEAIFQTADGPVVYRRKGLGREEVHPKLGRRNERQVEILSGLEEGDRVARAAPAPAVAGGGGESEGAK